MATRRNSPSEPVDPPRGAPARTPQGRENEVIAAAVDLAEKQIREGTASAQVISHYLKMGSSRERLEQERLTNEVALLQARREQLESEKRVEALYAEALEAMRSYAGQPRQIEGDYDEDPNGY